MLNQDSFLEAFTKLEDAVINQLGYVDYKLEDVPGNELDAKRQELLESLEWTADKYEGVIRDKPRVPFIAMRDLLTELREVMTSGGSLSASQMLALQYALLFLR